MKITESTTLIPFDCSHLNRERARSDCANNNIVAKRRFKTRRCSVQCALCSAGRKRNYSSFFNKNEITHRVSLELSSQSSMDSGFGHVKLSTKGDRNIALTHKSTYACAGSTTVTKLKTMHLMMKNVRACVCVFLAKK